MAGRPPKMVDGVKTTSHPLYKTWDGMKTRCYNVNNPGYPRYGGRGVKVCAEWRESFARFVEDMGPRPEGGTLDRINNDGNYEPLNCRWASMKTQQNNRRNVRRYDHDGRSLTISEWAEVTGLTQAQIYDRIVRRGWSAERALTTEVGNRLEYNGKSLTISEWAEVTGLTRGLIYERIYRYGWSVERALTEKVRKNGK